MYFFRAANEEEDEYGYFTLTFNIEFPHDNDTVYFAHSYPYTYSDLQVGFLIKKQLNFQKDRELGNNFAEILKAISNLTRI